MKAAIYLRKSRAEAGDEDALGRHRETLLRFAEHNQIVVEEIYEEIVSGENLYLRPQISAKSAMTRCFAWISTVWAGAIWPLRA